MNLIKKLSRRAFFVEKSIPPASVGEQSKPAQAGKVEINFIRGSLK